MPVIGTPAGFVPGYNGGTWVLAVAAHPDKGYLLSFDGAAWHIYGRSLGA